MEHPNPYESPKRFESASDGAVPPPATGYSPEYDQAFRTSVVVAAASGVLSALVLDNGVTGRAFFVAILCHMAMTSLIMARRPSSPTAFDLWLVRWGLIPLGLLIATVGTWAVTVLKAK